MSNDRAAPGAVITCAALFRIFTPYKKAPSTISDFRTMGTGGKALNEVSMPQCMFLDGGSARFAGDLPEFVDVVTAASH
jgi:hypothetical protein